MSRLRVIGELIAIVVLTFDADDQLQMVSSQPEVQH